MLHEEVDAVFLEGDGVGVGLGDALDDFDVFDVQLVSSRGRLSARTLPVTMTLDSCVRPLSASKTSGATLLTWATPCTVPVPSRKMGKSSLPLSREL